MLLVHLYSFLAFWLLREFWVLKRLLNTLEFQRGPGLMKTLVLRSWTLYTSSTFLGLWSQNPLVCLSEHQQTRSSRVAFFSFQQHRGCLSPLATISHCSILQDFCFFCNVIIRLVQLSLNPICGAWQGKWIKNNSITYWYSKMEIQQKIIKFPGI